MLQGNDNKHEMTLKRKYKSLLPIIPRREVAGRKSGFCLLLCLVWSLSCPSPLENKCYPWSENILEIIAY